MMTETPMEQGDYRTIKGHLFSFSGWPPNESPLELFDSKEWLKCLHATMFYLSRTEVRREDIEDDGILHELVHLASGIDICTHITMDDLREELERCLKRV